MKVVVTLEQQSMSTSDEANAPINLWPVKEASVPVSTRAMGVCASGI